LVTQPNMEIGVLALQGDFAEHITILQRMGITAREVRLPEHLTGLNGIIIPGGESTTIGKLAVAYNLIEPLRKFGQQHAIWGTCAGAIFLSRDIHRSQPLLELMDIIVERNAFGRQIASFEIDLEVPCLQSLGMNPPKRGAKRDDKGTPPTYGKAFHAVFIRAPLIESVSGDAKVLARLPDGRIVAARQGRLLATSFHPELTEDDRFHRFFVEMAK
jgi:5'-phosphate synthase pdxT subunit